MFCDDLILLKSKKFSDQMSFYEACLVMFRDTNGPSATYYKLTTNDWNEQGFEAENHELNREKGHHHYCCRDSPQTDEGGNDT